MIDRDSVLAEVLRTGIRDGDLDLEKGTPAYGITQQVISEGRSTLSDRQEEVFSEHVYSQLPTQCGCGGPVPLEEVEGYWINELCSVCNSRK